jgi:hypothetical protein
MWEPRPLATLGASTACNRDIYTLHYRVLRDDDQGAMSIRSEVKCDLKLLIVAEKFRNLCFKDLRKLQRRKTVVWEDFFAQTLLSSEFAS